MTEKPIKISGGDVYMRCCHITPNKRNEDVRVFPSGSPQFDIIRHNIDMAREAKWLMMCGECARVGDPMHGAPYDLHRASSDIYMTSGRWGHPLS